MAGDSIGHQITVIDLFSGCGGFSLGAHFAGFKSLHAFDIEPKMVEVYSQNFPNSSPQIADLSDDSSPDSIAAKLQGTIDGVIGGPPCQGFSEIGRRNSEDPRNTLVKHFFLHVAVIKPRFFVMENVRGLLFDGNRKILDEALALVSDSYEIIEPYLVDAADFGAPTRRKRVIVVGFQKGFGYEFRRSTLGAPQERRLISVKEAIYDLKGAAPIETDSAGRDWWQYEEKAEASEYAKWARTLPSNGLGSPIALERLERSQVTGQRLTAHSDAVVSRFSSVQPGQYDRVGRHQRLDWMKLCPTLRAGTASDKGSYQSVRPIHPEENRVITVREAARLQGFPDWFQFHRTTWHSFRMIGNSVSPLVSKAILEQVARTLRVPHARS